MKAKQLRIILGILGVGILLYLPSLLRTPRRSTTPSNGPTFSIPAPASSLRTVRILNGKNGDTIRLERHDAGWTTNGHPADSAKVADLLASLDTLRTFRIVARNPANHARLGVTAETGRRIELAADSGSAFSFFLGSRARGSDGSYVRRDGEAEVYLLTDPAAGYLGRDPDGWRIRLIAALDTGRIREIVMERKGRRTVLDRKDSGWTADGMPADSATVAKLLARLVEIRASGYPTDSVAAATSFDPPPARLEVFSADSTAQGGRTRVLALLLEPGEERGDDWLARRAEDSEVVELSSYVAGALLPDRKRLLGQ